MKISVRLFARARDLAGSPVVDLELSESATVADVRAALLQARPQLQPLAATLLVAVGSEYASDATVVPPGADVACFPPVSGG
jgi:molybdopterin converting factor small subunit